MSIGLLLLLFILGFLLWTHIRSDDQSTVALIVFAINMCLLALMHPEQLGIVLIVAGIGTFIGLFAIAGVMLGQRLTHSFKTSED